MEISKQTKKHLMEVIAFAIVLYCGIEHFDLILGGAGFVLQLIMPFLLGGVIAFIFNVPMKAIEKHLFTKNTKYAKFRRPLAYVLTLLGIIGVLVLAMVVVIPELGRTFSMLAAQIPQAFNAASAWLEEVPDKYPFLEPAVENLNIDWKSISASAVKIVQNMLGGLINSGVGLFSGIVSGVATFFIAFTFSVYVIFQKERLGRQVRQILYALLPKKATEKVLRVAALSNQVFSNFLSGQCLEAVILGTMFVVAMTIFRMPYAMLTGVVIAITALIPVVGAFIGCAVGALLIVMVNPMQAIWFIVLFLVLQQIEGNLIYPHVVGGSIGLPSIWVLVAITVGGNLFGMTGILVFIPLCSVLYALFREFIKGRLKEKKIIVAK